MTINLSKVYIESNIINLEVRLTYVHGRGPNIDLNEPALSLMASKEGF